MKRLLLYLLILISATQLYAQEKAIDSLENELKQYIFDDTTKVNLLNQLSLSYVSNDIDKSLEKAEEAYDLANKLNYKKGIATSHIRFSHIHRKKTNLDDAEKEAQLALKLFIDINDLAGINKAYISLGNIAYKKNDLDIALPYYEKVLEYCIKNEDLSTQAMMFNNIGIIEYRKANVDEAISLFKKSYALREQIGETTLGLTNLNNLGAICLNQGRYSEALDYFNKCLLIYREDNNKAGIVTATANLSAVYYELKQYNKTLSYLEETFKLSEELKDKSQMASCLINMGAVYTDLKEYPKALDFMTKSLNISKEINNKAELCAGYFQLGDLRLAMKQPKLALENYKTSLEISKAIGNKIYICHASIGLAQVNVALKEYSKALQYALEGEKIANDLALLAQQKLAAEILATIYSKTNNYKKAFESHQLFKTLNDSLFNKENVEKITQLEYEYKYQTEIALANEREKILTQKIDTTSLNLEKSQRNTLIGIIAMLLIAIISGAIIFFLKLKQEKEKVKYSSMEQKLLRSQMTPHFIFNSLSVLQGIILNKEQEKSIFYLSKFSKLLRIILENSREKTVLLKQELEAIENYLVLQNINIDPPCAYEISVDENIDTKLFHIPPMLIQPFIENVVEHAFGNIKTDRELKVHLSFKENKLICTIQDNGIGINAHTKETKNKSKRSLATIITAERLDILSKDFKFKGSIIVEDRIKYNEQGTLVTLILPYLKN